MNKIWYYILTPIVTAIFSIGLIYIWNSIYNFFKLRRLKKKIPNNTKELADAGKPLEIDRKEEEEDERRRFSKFREFEKLRFLEERERATKTTPRPFARAEREPERRDMEDQSDYGDSTVDEHPELDRPKSTGQTKPRNDREEPIFY